MASTSILWGNTSDQISRSPGALATVTLAITKTGGRVTDADPMFVGSGGHPYQLAAGSPCINAGNSAAAPAGITTDLAGLPRFVGIVDMGAYKFQSCYADCDARASLDFLDFLLLPGGLRRGLPVMEQNGP